MSLFLFGFTQDNIHRSSSRIHVYTIGIPLAAPNAEQEERKKKKKRRRRSRREKKEKERLPPMKKKGNMIPLLSHL